MKKIAVINDLSGFGRCSLTAAIPVISAMGIQVCPLPTAILTAQTGYDTYYCDDYTEKIDIFHNQWKIMDSSFDGIYTGFLANSSQIEKILSFLETFKTSSNFLLVDPILGDAGIPYKIFSPSLCEEMKRLTARADIATPNLTELCLLTGSSFSDLDNIRSNQDFFAAIDTLGKKLCGMGTGKVVVTGIHHKSSGKDMIGNMYITKSENVLISFPHVGGSYSGTGDIFASIIAAGYLRGMDIPDSVALAGKFLEISLIDAVAANIPRNDGVPFENHLDILINNFR